MKILYTTDTYHPNVDGVVKALDLLVKALSNIGYEIIIVGPKTNVQIPNYHGYDGFELPFYREYKLVIPNFNDFYDVDLVHNHGLGLTSIYGVRLAKKLNIKVLGHYHTDIVYATHYVNAPKALAKLYVKHLLNSYDLTLSPSPKIERRLIEYGVKNVTTLEIPIDLSKYQFSDRKDNYLLHVGRLVKEKRLDMIFPYLKDIDIPLYVVGKGPAMEYYKTKAEQYKADIRFLGFVSEDRLIELYRDAKALVFASNFDTLGLVCIEAMASGTPVIAHQDTAIADYLSYDSLFYDKDSFIRSIQNLERIDAYELRKIASRFDINNIVKRYDEVYKRYTN